MADQPSGQKQLHRSETDKWVAGVCGGIAEYFNADPALVRVVFVLIVVFTGFFPGVLAYLVAALVMPKDPTINAANPPAPRSNDSVSDDRPSAGTKHDEKL